VPWAGRLPVTDRKVVGNRLRLTRRVPADDGGLVGDGEHGGGSPA
jgi:hypothetical protein